MKRKIKIITVSLLVVIAMIGNTSVLSQRDMDTDVSIGNLIHSTSANAEGDNEYTSEYCASCQTEYGQTGVRWGCESDYGSCSFVPCLYGYC
ncbi:MAG: hypothetical protein Q8T08_03500 [Ignavibacteria bacterium]|nr:hypothetical protein [Ignavibacteria bacterium]